VKCSVNLLHSLEVHKEFLVVHVKPSQSPLPCSQWCSQGALSHRLGQGAPTRCRRDWLLYFAGDYWAFFCIVQMRTACATSLSVLVFMLCLYSCCAVVCCAVRVCSTTRSWSTSTMASLREPRCSECHSWSHKQLLCDVTQQLHCTQLLCC
jgi:hypothetical protein